jgi:hypothetical protein
VAVAVQATTITLPGSVLFFNTNGVFLKSVAVGALPDMLTFNHDGTLVYVANEGEPAGGVDPEGSVSVVDLRNGLLSATAATASFAAYNDKSSFLRNRGVRLWPDVPATVSVAQDLEPEYLTLTDNETKPYVTLQEANAAAIVNVANPAAPVVTDIVSLSLKDHFLGEPKLTTYEIANRPVIGSVLDADGNPRDILLGGFSGLYFEGKVDGKARSMASCAS